MQPYLRVSTGRQAENDLSIPDQRRQAKAYCASRGWEVGRGWATSIGGTQSLDRSFWKTSETLKITFNHRLGVMNRDCACRWPASGMFVHQTAESNYCVEN